MLISVDSLVATAKLILPSIAEYASKTESVWDDAMVKFFETALNNKVLIDWLKSVLDTPAVIQSSGAARDGAIMAACQANLTPEVEQAIAATGTDPKASITFVLSLLRVLLAIFGI